MSTGQLLEQVLNRLTKWRSVFAGWQRGTRPSADPECQAVRDHREATILHRAEISALTRLLIDKGVFTLEEFQNQLMVEATHLDHALEKRFPGFKATDVGMSIDLSKAKDTMKGWKP